MAESPERMREAVEAAAKVIQRRTTHHIEYCREIVQEILPHLSAPPSQLPDDIEYRIAWSARKWVHGSALGQCGPGADECQDWPTANEITAAIMPVIRAAYAVDSRPSLDLTDEELEALVEYLEGHYASVPSKVGMALVELSDELARRAGPSGAPRGSKI